MAKGLPPREATIKALEEITGPVIAITLVLSPVFIPTAFIAGISGQFYRQFALTIAASTIISAINAMTMAPARAVTLIKPHKPGEERHEALPKSGVVLLFALLFDFFLTDLVLGLFGLSAGGHGHEAHGSPTALWTVRLLVVGAGAVLGYVR
jgi:multidrug efflux pump